MTDISLILGEKGSGKTALAKELTADYNTVYLNASIFNSPNPFWAISIDKTTDVIVIDEITSIKQVDWLMNSKTIKVNKPYAKLFSIPRPELILITNSVNELPFLNADNHNSIKFIHDL